MNFEINMEYCCTVLWTQGNLIPIYNFLTLLEITFPTMANLRDFCLRKSLLLEKSAKPDFARLYTLYLSSPFSTMLCLAFSPGKCSLLISFMPIYPTVSSPFSKLSQESHIPSLFICEFLTTGAFWQNLRKCWLKRRKRGKGLVFKDLSFLPHIRGNLFKIKQTCYKITYTVQCICTYNVIINTFSLSEKTTGKSATPARSDFMETAEFTHYWIMLLSQWFSIVIYFDWHQKPSRTVNCKDTRKKSLTKWLDSSC